MTPAIYSGERALHRTRAGEFRKQWKALHAQCPWATACQHPDFVLPWYALYHELAVPIIVTAEDHEGRLIGLLTLALFKDGNRLVAAGERQAEYQAWLETPETDNAFIKATTLLIRESFPGTDLQLKYLPPGTPLNWARDDPNFASLFTLRSHERPIMQVDPVQADKQKRKGKIRQNFNRLSRSGEVRFERITDHERFIEVFDTICLQYDFRQMALYHAMPFTNDAAKKPFHVELHKQGLLHVTLLTVGGEFVAAHCGMLSRGSVVHFGISTFAPQFASCSPGQLLIAFLGVQLAQEGIRLFDLTPGGDEYKGRYASTHDLVHEMTMYGSANTRLKGETFTVAKRMLKDGLRQVGLSTSDARAAVKKVTRFRELGLRGVVERMRRPSLRPRPLYRLESPVESCLDSAPDADQAPMSLEPLRLGKDAIDDMFRFDPRGSHMTRWEFLNSAIQRMEVLNHVYTYHEGRALLAYCWVGMVNAVRKSPTVKAETEACDSVLLSDLYVRRHGLDRERVRLFIAQVVSDVKSQSNGKDIYFAGPMNKELRGALADCGFVAEKGNAPTLTVAGSRLHPSWTDQAMNEPGQSATMAALKKQADGTIVSCYLGEVPPYVGGELVRLYNTLHSSLMFFQVFRSVERVNCYVAQRGKLPTAIFLFTRKNGRIEVLNEMIEVDRVELERFVHYVFAVFPSAGSVSFKAIRTDTDGLPFPLQKYSAKDTYVIDLPATASEYTASLGRSTRTAVRYQLNKVKRDHPSFESRFYEKEDIEPQHVVDILRYSEARISSRAYKFSHDDQRIIRLAQACGFVHVLYIDGKLCAGSINYRVGNSVFGEAIGQDPEYERYGLGKLTVYLTVCESIARGARKFYLGGGRFDFKSRMLGKRLEMDRIEIYRSPRTMLRHIDSAAKTALHGQLRRLKTWLRDHEETLAARMVFGGFYRWRNLLQHRQSISSGKPDM